MQILAVIEGNQWEPGIGDPTFMGWLTVVAYLITSLLCVVCAQQTNRMPYPDRDDKQRLLWWSLALVLLLLGINKQLDLQSWFTQVGRQLAISEGWYQERRGFQIEFIAGIALVAFVLILLTVDKMINELRESWLAMLGIIFLISFVVIRAASFHHIDQMLHWQLAGFQMNWILELGGIACIGVSAVNYLHRH